MRRVVSRLTVTVLVLASFAVAAQNPSRFSPDKIKKIETAISAEMSRHQIPGLSVAVVTGNELRWSSGYGMADLENFVPAKATTVYRLGSISKPVTAAAVMQLVERGKLDLDAPVQKNCPSFPEKQWPVTTRQLLSHLGGVRHYGSEAEFASTRRYTKLADTLDIFKNDPLLHEPGTKYSYTTYGFNLLGCVVEGASGQSFMDYLGENVFKPAGLVTMRDDDVHAIIPNRAQGYQKTRTGELRNSGLADTSIKIPGGGLVSTAEDLARFAIAMQTGRLVKKETLDQMWTRQKTRAGEEIGYGLGWGVDRRDGVKEVHHGGAQQRVTTFLYLMPEKGAAVAIMTNLEGVGGALRSLCRQIADIAIQE
ncbi:MAG TPA: serine hydrolase domain-containing protein [Blastocatellia bacterium]|nr:serine hydrolase domain-containing protein [Blastocatellia bacterium]